MQQFILLQPNIQINKMSKIRFLSFHGSFSKKAATTPNPKPPPPIKRPPTTQITAFQSSKEDIKKIFNKLDTNSDGKISIDEYKQALKVLGGGAKSPGEAEKAFAAADADGDGFIDLEELESVFNRDGGVKRGEIEEAFRVFDSNGDGKISAEELMEVLRRMGERCSVEGCRKMIRGVDRDGDGLIDMDEFINMMASNTIKLA